MNVIKLTKSITKIVWVNLLNGGRSPQFVVKRYVNNKYEKIQFVYSAMLIKLKRNNTYRYTTMPTSRGTFTQCIFAYFISL